MTYAITIPTILPKSDSRLIRMGAVIGETCEKDDQIFFSCVQQSAAKNRNLCIDSTQGDIIIQLDDDIVGFFPGWIAYLLKPFEDPSIAILSARLFDKNGNVGQQGAEDVADTNVQDLRHRLGIPITCSAAIAWRRSLGVRFDENYIAAVLEDTDFFLEIHRQFPDMRKVVNNRCRLIHLNEMKARNSKTFEHNKNYFEKKWNIFLWR